jgi:hypothetical protein
MPLPPIASPSSTPTQIISSTGRGAPSAEVQASVDARVHTLELALEQLVEVRNASFSPEEACGLGHLSHEREVLRLDLQGQMERVGSALQTARTLQSNLAEWATQDKALVSNF